MTSYFEFNEGRKPVGDVIEFKKPHDAPVIEHVDASTIVEKLDLTPEMQKEFEALGYTFPAKDSA